MKFLAKKEDIFNGIRLVANVAAMKSLQPVLANISFYGQAQIINNFSFLILE